MSEAQKKTDEAKIDPAEFAELMKTVKGMSTQLAFLDQRNRELEAAAEQAATGGILPEEEQPVYEVLNPQGFNAPDSVFYPEGAQFVDLMGCLIPNDQFLPLNRAADERMDAYIKSLPGQVRTPPLDMVLEAAMQLRDMPGDRADYSLAVMQKAIEIATRQGAKIQITDPITRPVKMSNVPLMTNSRFNGQMGALSKPSTRYRGEGPGPGDRQEPAMTNGRSELLGRFAPPRVRAG